MAIDQPMTEGTLSQKMSENLLRISMDLLVQMFGSRRKPVGGTWKFSVPCGDASVMVTLEEDYPSAVAIADKCRELGAESLRGKRTGRNGVDGQIVCVAPVEAVEELRACADSQGWTMTVEGTVRRW